MVSRSLSVIGAVLLLLVPMFGTAVLEENALDGCGVTHSALHATANGWHYTPCHSENNGACFVKAHEERYQALVEACQAEHTNQSTQIREYRAGLPKLSSDVIVALSQLNITLRTHRDRLESLVRDQHDVLLNTTDYAVQLERDITVASLEANRTDQALRYYGALLHEPTTVKELILESYQGSGGSSTRKVALLLQFIRGLPDATDRTAGYRQLGELLETNQQHERAPGILYAEDAARYGTEQPDPERYPKRTLERWRSQLADGFFTEPVQFATDYPEHYERIEPDLLRPLAAAAGADSLPRLIEYPNALPRLEQRVRAFRLLLRALQQQQQQHPNGQQLHDRHLLQLAGEVSKLEQQSAGGKMKSATTEEDVSGALTEVRQLFPQFTYDRSFLTYSELFAQYKPVV
uniref:Putative secreted protein n=1 Tax=Anopheles darlingi TaxID=43151 RepID=A0A2M4DQE3_ANODA